MDRQAGDKNDMKIVGSLRWNVSLGIFAMIVTWIFSWGNNLLSTSLIRALMAFVVFFTAAYVFRYFLSFLLCLNSPSESIDLDSLDKQEGKGVNVDLVTPDDDSILQTNEFQSMNPSDLAKALRTLTDK
jgi:hypothetical protein